MWIDRFWDIVELSHSARILNRVTKHTILKIQQLAYSVVGEFMWIGMYFLWSNDEILLLLIRHRLVSVVSLLDKLIILYVCRLEILLSSLQSPTLWVQ